MNKKALVIYSKTRFFIFIISLIVFFTLILNTAIARSFNEAGTNPDQYITVEISEGDTIWDIASYYSDNSTDIRELIYEIGRYNNINSGDIVPGMTIKIPTQI